MEIKNFNSIQFVIDYLKSISNKTLSDKKVGLSLAVYSTTFFLGCAGNLLILFSVAAHGQVMVLVVLIMMVLTYQKSAYFFQ